MITLYQIERVLEALDGAATLVLDETESGILKTLKRFEDRGAFDGSLPSAITCLTQAGYGVQKPEPAA